MEYVNVPASWSDAVNITIVPPGGVDSGKTTLSVSEGYSNTGPGDKRKHELAL